MVIKKIYIILFLLCYGVSKAQVTADIVKETNEKYAKFYTSRIQAISPNNKRMLMLDYNVYGMQRAFTLDVESKKTMDIQSSFLYNYFFDDDILLAQLIGAMEIRDLKKNIVKKLVGSFRYIPFEDEKKFVLYERQKKQLLVFDSSLNEIFAENGVQLISERGESSIFTYATVEGVHMLNMKTMKTRQWQFSEKIHWMGIGKSNMYALVLSGNQFKMYEFGDKNEPNISNIDPPINFTTDANANFGIEIRDDRFLLLPLVKKLPFQKSEPAEISYSNQNNSQRNPLSQLAIYDLHKKSWAREPEQSAIFSQQKIIDDKGTLIHYDLSSNTVDSTENVRYPIVLEKNFGQSKISIDNPYNYHLNFHFDRNAGKMIYFRDGKWWLQDVEKGTVIAIPFESPHNFLTDTYSGLDEVPSGNIYATNLQNKYIISDSYDLFLVDIDVVAVKRLTFGREKGISYNIPTANPLQKKSTKLVFWDKQVVQSVNLEEKLILKMFRSKDYFAGLSEMDPKTLRMKELFFGEEMVHDVFVLANSIMYTTESYQKPLAVFVFQNGVKKLVYQSKGIEGTKLPELKKELITYKVDGTEYKASLLYPVNFNAEKRYPLIWHVYEKEMPRQVLRYSSPNIYQSDGLDPLHYVYNGYFVLLPALAYELENVGRSISKSVDSLTDMLSYNKSIDLTKMGISGSSFGGYETNFLMAQGKWFATGFSGVSIADLPSNALVYFKGMKRPNYVRTETGQIRMVKSLFDNYQGYLDNSPIYHLKKMSKPILLWTGKEDSNVHPNQSEAFFLGLKRLQKQGVLLEYPKEGHAIQNRDNQLDLNVKGWQWMDHFLKGEPAADWMKPLLN